MKVRLNYDSLTTYNTTNPLNPALVTIIIQTLYKSKDKKNINTDEGVCSAVCTTMSCIGSGLRASY